jgi:YesN/AraC family two-component response regulator
LEEYYSSIPVLAENDRIFFMIDTFCEHIWHQPSFAIVEVNEENDSAALSLEEHSRAVSVEETLANIHRMELRYSFENDLLRAVSLGQQHKDPFFTMNEEMFEKRLEDPVRNAKNYCIIMNTLLRKAAEHGGVHPFYVDRLSSRFAEKIEQVGALKESNGLMKEMFSTYCRLVYKHSVKKYSPLVQKTVLLIDADLSADLTLSQLAELQGISEGYLATLFKKETGKTVSEYVRERRIKHAMHLLKTTNLQIQTVAAHCGILDVQYFSKQFKRQTGKTPKEYRQEVLQPEP